MEDSLQQVCSKARRNLFYLSEVPEVCKGSDSVYLGIDEAGRGPVLGDMTYSAAYWRECDNDSIKELGYDGELMRNVICDITRWRSITHFPDSKALTSAQRSNFYKGITQVMTNDTVQCATPEDSCAGFVCGRTEVASATFCGSFRRKKFQKRCCIG